MNCGKRTIMDYMIIEENYSYDLTQIVKKLVRQGWVPQGGVSVSGPVGMTKVRYVQAMVKHDGE